MHILFLFTFIFALVLENLSSILLPVAATVTGRHKSFEKRKPPQFFHPPVHALNQYRATLSGDTACRPLQELQNYIPHTAIDQVFWPLAIIFLWLCINTNLCRN